MSATKIALLGAIAGFTIYLGLPVGRLSNPAPRTRALLNALATGILIFLLWDVLAHAWEPVDAALADDHYGSAVGDFIVMIVAIGVALLGLVYFDQWIGRRNRRTTGKPLPTSLSASATSPTRPVTSASASGRSTTALAASAETTTGLRGASVQLATLIAVGIGLHNFAEGLAIGNSAASGEIALALLLIIGFGLHNATEGFGIVAPMAAAGVRASWGQLALLGLIGGGPTFVGTLIGQRFTSEITSVAFLSLAAGSILYVVIELLAVARRSALKEITTWGLFLGLVLGFATDAIVTAAGA